jgi:hypothetical protein
MEGTNETITQNLNSPKYRMREAHFKLGSKIHITDFIYARKMFQQNEYVNIFANEVVNYIKKNIQNGDYTLKKSEDGKKRVTLIGYASYSQMLLNKIVVNIQNDNDIIVDKINYDLLSDVDTTRFLKKETIYENILIIVPITTTFSTSVKIERDIIDKALKEQSERDEIEYDNEYINTFNFLEPYVNLILVSPVDLNDPSYVVKLNEYLNTEDESDEKNKEYPYPCKLFKWKNVDTTKKEITIDIDKSLRKRKVENNENEMQRKEKYFYSIESRWYVPDSCPHCFPDDNHGLIEEKLLLETDKTSVTPKLQLDLSRSYVSHIQGNDKKSEHNIYIKEDSHKCSHYEHLDEHFLHFINAKIFFDTYRLEIEQWADALKKKYLKDDLEKVLLISPSRGNNIFFVDFINHYLFGNEAKIISYEVDEDYIENYQKFFKDYIESSKNIFYVDTFLKSGGTFRLVNNFLKYCKAESEKNSKNPSEKNSKNPCDGLIFLISKANDYVKNNVSSLLRDEENFFRFHELYIQNIEKKTCPLCLEQERYKKLAENSILDTVRHYFLNKVTRLRTREVGSIKDDDSGLTDWEKYHPLVKDSELIVFPWEKGASSETGKLYETFIKKEGSSHSLPRRKYLKLLIEHKLNYLLSNNEDIIERIKESDTLDLSKDKKDKNIESNEKLLLDIIEEIKKEDPFKGWIEGWKKHNVPTLEIFNSIFKEVVLKVFTLQPFINSMHVKKRVFAWVLIELDEHVEKLVNSSEKIDFDDFRKLKFLMRRVTLLNSNYIIRKKTLKALKIIMGKIYKNDYSFFEIEQKNYQAAENIEDINDDQKNYVEQIKKNIEYKDRSYNEFNYFYVSLIKELLIENPSKVTKIESNINYFLEQENIKEEKTFYNLLKLIQYENTIAIKQGLTIVAENYLNKKDIISFNNKFRIPEVRKELTNGFKEAMNDSRLSTLKKFIGLNQEDHNFNFNKWSQTEDFYHYLHLLYLLTVLLKEEINIKFAKTTKLEDKMETILQNLFRIACDPNFKIHDISIDSIIEYEDDPNSGAFIVLKFRSEHEDYAKPEDLFMAYVTKNITEPAPNMEVDNESLSYFMINGLCNKSIIKYNQKYYKPNTILQFNKIENENKWYPLIGHLSTRAKDNNISIISSEFSKIYDSQTGFGSTLFTEDIYIPNSDISKYCFLRIADLKIDEKENTVKNEGSGVVTFFSKEEFDIKRLRLVMVVKDQIQKFIERHYETDSITAFINERIKLREYDKLSHGFKRYLSKLNSLAKSTDYVENRELFADILYAVTKNGPILQEMTSKLEGVRKMPYDVFNEKLMQHKLDDLEICKDECMCETIQKIEEIIKIIIENKVSKSDEFSKEKYIFNCINANINKAMLNTYSWSIYLSIIVEIIVNAKKSVDDGNNFNLDLSIKQDTDDSDLLWFVFSNKYDNEIYEKERLRMKKNNMRFSKKGISMIKRLSEASTNYLPIININDTDKIFTIEMPFKSIIKIN